jgi:small-conductance mechanosensitive channel
MDGIISPEPARAIDPQAPIASGFLDRVAGFFQSILRFVLSDQTFLAALKVAGVLAADAFMIWFALRLLSRLSRHLREKAMIGDLRLRSWVLSSAEQNRAGILRTLRYLRFLLVSIFLGLAILAINSLLHVLDSYQAISLVRGFEVTIAVTLAWLLLVRAFRGFESSMLRRFDSADEAIRPLKYRSLTILSGYVIQKAIRVGIRLLGWILLILSAAALVALVFASFSITWSWSHSIFLLLGDIAKPVAAALVVYIPRLGLIALIAIASRMILRLVRSFFREVEEGRIHFPWFSREWAPTTYKIVRLFIVLLALVMAFPYIPGSDSEAFRAIGIFVGVLLSLGSSSFVGNILAGVALTYMNPYKIGDRVKIGSVTGDVAERTLLITRVRTIKNVVVTIPNAIVLGAPIENFAWASKEMPLVLHTSVTIGYEVPWREVHSALLNAAVRIDGILEQPKPFILQVALNDWSVSYELNAYTSEPSRMAELYSGLHANIQDSFVEAGIEIMTPAYTALRDGSGSTIPAKKASDGGEGGQP